MRGRREEAGAGGGEEMRPRDDAVSVCVPVGGGEGGPLYLRKPMSRGKALEKTSDWGALYIKPFLGKPIWGFYTGELLCVCLEGGAL